MEAEKSEIESLYKTIEDGENKVLEL